MEFSEYIVPVFAVDGYRGNAFIVSSLLILPYHLLKVDPNSWEVYPSFEYVYNKNVHRLETKTSIIEEGYKQEVADNPYYARDLLVFRSNIDNSDLTLSSEYDEKEDCVYYGYNEDERGELKREILQMGRVLQQKAVVDINGKPSELNNCMTCICKLKPGNSGGLVCQGNNIIGMFIKDQSFPSGASQSIFIKASYIIQVIENNLKS